MDSSVRFPGIPDVINGNGAVAYVMRQVCGGVIGFPITPSTEISELFEAARADGQLNVWGKHPFFVETEGEHSAQSGALGATLTGGHFISNASSSQGILYGLESHYMTVGRRVGGFVLQVAARVVGRASLNVMAGHDDVYSLLPAGYTIVFGSNPQEAADLAAIAYRISSLSLVPVTNAMDGFATSHVMSEALLPEPELLREYLGDPAGRIPCPTVAQELLLGAKGRVFQLQRYLDRHVDDFPIDDLATLRAHLASMADRVEADADGTLINATLAWVPEDLRGQWRRQWLGAWQKGTRQLCPAYVDPNDPGMTGPVQNQPDFQSSAADRMTHFTAAVPALARQAMAEYSALTGRHYAPLLTYDCEDADYIMVGMGSITDDVRAVLPYLRGLGIKVGCVSVKLLQPFPEAEFIAAAGHAKVITVLERSDETALTRMVNQALFRARSNGERPGSFPGVPAIDAIPQTVTGILGLGSHDVQPRHLVAAVQHMVDGPKSPLIFIGSQFFVDNPTPAIKEIQDKMRAAYPETELMALKTGDNPSLLPPGAIRIRFHSVGGYGTVSTGKLLTDILSNMLHMKSKSSPKYGSEKSGAATNYYITLSPEPVLITNAELEDVEVVVAPDHMVFAHENPLKGLVAGGTLILQSSKTPLEVWRELPAFARRTIRERGIRLLIMDAFAIARTHAPAPELETRMMGIAFIGAIIGNVDQVAAAANGDVAELVRHELDKKFGRKGQAVVDSNMDVIRDGMKATLVDYTDPAFLAVEAEPERAGTRASLSAAMYPSICQARPTALFDPDYFDATVAAPFREGTIDEAPAFPGGGTFLPPGTGASKNKGLFRRVVPSFDASTCTACMECALVCPDSAIPNTVHEIADLLRAAVDAAGIEEPDRFVIHDQAPAWADAVRQALKDDPSTIDLAVIAKATASTDDRMVARHLDAIIEALAAFPVAKPRPIFDVMEKADPGSGALYSVVVDPWKCTGCLECVAVCGPHSLTAVEQDDEFLATLEGRFQRLTKLPDTPKRFTDGTTTPGGDLKRMLLKRSVYYSLVGGHGACKGCGEVTATHLLTSASHALGDERLQEHRAMLDGTINQLRELLNSGVDDARRVRIESTIAELDHRLYLYESGPAGNGPSTTAIVNSTGCSSVYSSTQPFSPFVDPWVNGLFQDAQPLAVGIYEGFAANIIDEVKALRVATLELAGAYDPAVHDAQLKTLAWRDFTDDELALIPDVITIAGDGAAYDIGFGAMSRVFAEGTPIKMLVLDTGGYSNTGGQASTASFHGQDSDLSRYGRAHHGKSESRKELGILAALHPNVFVASSTTATYSHFLAAAVDMLSFNEGASLLLTYTPCDTENGLPDDMSAEHARAAVESRMAPLFVHDPRKGATLSERLDLSGNPDVDALWTSHTLAYTDDQGTVQLLTQPFTPADFAATEGRFSKQFRPLLATEEPQATPIADYIELPQAQRAAHVPFITTVDGKGHLVKRACSQSMVDMVENRKNNWLTLRFLAGLYAAALTESHQVVLDAVMAQYHEAVDARETSMDAIARAMADLATARKAPTSDDMTATIGGALAGMAAPAQTVAAAPVPAAAPAPAPAAAAPVAAAAERPIWLDPADAAKCTDCGTCYQELPELFEKVTVVISGAAKTVARMKDGALNGLHVTPELAAKITRVRATCDGEIIQ